MLCFRDTTFCMSKSCNNKCGRKMTEEQKEEYRNNNAFPISWGLFCEDESAIEPKGTTGEQCIE